ncbi:MAG: hypothetical protein LH465_02490 [Sphingomonas bacterium]|nr:hypothetical protein [Sphingomonas bacterium]
MIRAAVIALVGGLAACTDPPATRIDGSSPDAFAVSTAAARQDLPAADRLMFDSAIATVPARLYANRDPAATARAAFDGLTAAEIVAIERNRTSGERR